MFTSDKCRREAGYGVDFLEDGTVILAERLNGESATSRYPAGTAGVTALQTHIDSNPANRRVCIRSCGAAAMAIALGLAGLSRAEIMLVAPHALESSTGHGRDSAPKDPESRALVLARLAERLI